MRGERETHDIAEGWTTGSSPHARGTRIHSAPGGGLLRFIPACAGNAYRFPAGSWAAAVHPRMRGERPPPRIDPLLDHGSSPHARGTREMSLFVSAILRFIPACAGNACGSADRQPDVPVHPRMRGERHEFRFHFRNKVGSSPHARGTLGNPLTHSWEVRFIPACAGNAPPSRSVRCRRAVHPRMRGERPPAVCVDGNGFGSSPHARGTQRLRESRADLFRFIPACAGNAGHVPARGAPDPVHPRMRGERVWRQPS